ncbi:MAG: DUF3772 domain-containing protein [Beijerinckiaceae bacterium]
MAMRRNPMIRHFLQLFRLLLAVLFMALAVPALAQENEAKAALDKIRGEITGIEKDVQANLANDAGLVEQRGRLEPLLDQLRGFIGGEAPRLDSAKARLEQLGPKPDASKGQSEAPEVAREREEQEKAQREAEGVLALARNHTVAIEQIASRISDQRRSLLTKALMERTASVFSPVLWLDVAKALPAEVRSAQLLFGAWLDRIAARLDLTRIAILTVALSLLLIVAFPGHRYLRNFEGRPKIVPTLDKKGKEVLLAPSRLSRVLAALRVTLIWAIVPVLVCAGLYGLFDSLGLIHERAQGMVRALLYGVAFVAFAHGIADGILAPEDPDWRLIDVDDRTAEKITQLASLFTAIIVTGKTVEALNQAIFAVLPVTVATKSLFALLGGLAIVNTLRGLREPVEEDDDSKTSPTKAASLSGGTTGAIRLSAWAAATAILLACAFGYAALAAFVTDQIIWLAMVGAILLILLMLADEYVGHGLSPDGAMGRQVMSQVGVSKSSLKQVSILSNGFLRVVLIMAAAMLVLAPWGLDGGDTLGTLRAALFGFTVGGVTISLSTIIAAVALFAVGFSVTRAIQRWLEKSYLPHTKLDIGLRNSIATSIGYIGIVIAAMMAASTLGLSLDRFTIVAGALSVGIGFGLQSIVNNFVSGLILLWERPIRVGDWIVVGEEQGIVKRINVRSTQIETFDRASLIVPNAEFISGRVKNWTHSDRVGRITIPVGVGYGSDAQLVRKILLDVAEGHPEVMKDPAPRVFFMRLGDPSMDFELRCFCDVDRLLPVKSDLLFEILGRLQKARIDMPMPKRPSELLPVKEDGPMADGEREEALADRK